MHFTNSIHPLIDFCTNFHIQNTSCKPFASSILQLILNVSHLIRTRCRLPSSWQSLNVPTDTIALVQAPRISCASALALFMLMGVVSRAPPRPRWQRSEGCRPMYLSTSCSSSARYQLWFHQDHTEIQRLLDSFGFLKIYSIRPRSSSPNS